jgi:hypothetical protein
MADEKTCAGCEVAASDPIPLPDGDAWENAKERILGTAMRKSKQIHGFAFGEYQKDSVRGCMFVRFCGISDTRVAEYNFVYRILKTLKEMVDYDLVVKRVEEYIPEEQFVVCVCLAAGNDKDKFHVWTLGKDAYQLDKGYLLTETLKNMTLAPKENGKNCMTCGHLHKEMMVCSRCKSAYYCDRNCQSDDWKRHKKECTRSVSVKIQSIYFFFLFTRPP